MYPGLYICTALWLFNTLPSKCKVGTSRIQVTCNMVYTLVHGICSPHANVFPCVRHLEYINTRATNAMCWCNHATTIPWLSILQRKPHGYIACRHFSNVHTVSLSRALCHQVSINRVTYTYKYTFIYNSSKWIFSTITSRLPCDACDCRVPDTQISLSKVTLQNLLVRKYTLTPHTHMHTNFQLPNSHISCWSFPPALADSTGQLAPSLIHSSSSPQNLTTSKNSVIIIDTLTNTPQLTLYSYFVNTSELCHT